MERLKVNKEISKSLLTLDESLSLNIEKQSGKGHSKSIEAFTEELPVK